MTFGRAHATIPLAFDNGGGEIMQQTDRNAITEGVIWKQILIFFIPVALGTFFQQMYNTVDALVVGNFVDIALLVVIFAQFHFLSFVNSLCIVLG